MSDTEEEGTFDKEAEREKLRKQLEREEEERRTTQHMSELLLKGATMTNKHCDNCGDPLFRYEGQEFCPTCSQAGAGETQEEGQQAAAGGDAGAQAGTSGQSAEIDRVDTGTSTGATETREPQSPDAGEGEAATPGPTGAQPTRPRQPAPQAREGDVGGNVADARAALSRKLATLARQAEATDDVSRSRDLLAAAREAAEALAAIDAVGR